MCGTQPIQPVGISSARIVGGMEARPNSWPWQCAVYGDLGGGGFMQCGGSVISSTYILTAAHCLYVLNTLLLYHFRNFLSVACFYIATANFCCCVLDVVDLCATQKKKTKG